MNKSTNVIAKIVIVSGLYLIPSVLYAQFEHGSDEEMLSGFYGGEDIISIATGQHQPIAKAPAVATVITSKQIEDMGATDLDEVLETVPGLHVSYDHFGYAPIYIFRGVHAHYNPQILMLINGVPLTALFHGDRNLIWGGMSVRAISRIEVIRGPGSAVYGADAFAGVINIITKSGEDIKNTEVGIRAGSYSTKDAWVLTSTEIGGGELGFALEYHDTDGQDETIESDAQTNLDQAFNTNASLAPGSVNLSRENIDMRIDYALEKWQFRAGLQRRSDFGNGAGVASALDPHNRYKSERWNADITYHDTEFADNWELTAQISYLDTTQEVEEDLIIYPPGTVLPFGTFPDGLIGNPEVFERHLRASTNAFYKGFSDHLIRVGVGYYHGDIYEVRETKNFGIDPATDLPIPQGGDIVDVTDTPYVFLPEENRENRHLFIQDVWDIAADWELTAGIRYDDYSDFGDTTNPRLALVWSTTHDLTTKFLYGKAFRSPSLAQSLAINNPVVLGNPDLSPETLESFEVAINYQPTDTLSMGFNIFHYQWEDIIQFVPDMNANSSTAQNAGEQQGNGFEVELSWSPLLNLDINSSFSLQSSTDESTDKKTAHSPQKQFYIAALWGLPHNWQCHIQVNSVMDRQRAPDDTRRDVDDYTLTNITMRYKPMMDGLGMAIAVRNLFDEDAREPSTWTAPADIPNDLPLAGRSYFLELSYVLP